MMLGVKLFIDLFIANASLLVGMSCLGLCSSVCVHLKGLSRERDHLEPAPTFNFVCFALKSDRYVQVDASGVFMYTAIWINRESVQDDHRGAREGGCFAVHIRSSSELKGINKIINHN